MSGDSGHQSKPFVVGMVNVTCPSCADNVVADVRIESVSNVSGAYLHVKFQSEAPTHECTGRRS